MKDTCLCVFAKAPVSGKVKTRLFPVLSEQQACRTHKTLLQHCLSQVQHADWHSQLWTTDTSHPDIKNNAQQHVMSLHEQRGTDLGERMAFAVQQSLKDFKYVIIIGTDCPSINAELVKEVDEKLKSGFEVVLGPALDGGYVLIGMSVEENSLFKDIQWGTDEVLNTTRTRLRDADIDWHEISPQRDIDRPADLGYLRQAYPDLFHSIGVSLSLPQSDQEPG